MRPIRCVHPWRPNRRVDRPDSRSLGDDLSSILSHPRAVSGGFTTDARKIALPKIDSAETTPQTAKK